MSTWLLNAPKVGLSKSAQDDQGLTVLVPQFFFTFRRPCLLSNGVSGNRVRICLGQFCTKVGQEYCLLLTFAFLNSILEIMVNWVVEFMLYDKVEGDA